MIKVGIVGAGGYAGVNLINILLRHPQVEIKWLMSEEAHKGKDICELYPHLTNIFSMKCQTLDDLDKMVGQIDLVFLALPHGIALNYVPAIIAAGKKVVDLGADYRFDNEEVFKKWYNIEHKDKKAFKMAVFGSPELFKADIKKAQLIGNPGCYPTASILGIAPLAKAGLIDLSGVMVDAKSGVSGAGRGVNLKTHYCERNDGIMAYAVTNHRHMGEIEYQVTRISGDQGTRITFVPHLVPMTRGILTTIYAKFAGTGDLAFLRKTYRDFYKDAPFVRIFDEQPCTKNVVNTNYCDISVDLNTNSNTVIVTSAIDNLIKGAAGQAIQNMNLICGFPEDEGLKNIGVYP
ncbi:MAG: N-acetyl-gamma-glutamyl-phosphate reductase [Candidatus Margulisiibacteriota bacterium]